MAAMEFVRHERSMAPHQTISVGTNVREVRSINRSFPYFADYRRQLVSALHRPAALFLDQSDHDEGYLDSLSAAARTCGEVRRVGKLSPYLSPKIILDAGNHDRSRGRAVQTRR